MSKTATQKKPVPQDWHPADVIAALRKVGWSLIQLGYTHGYRSTTALATALHKPYPKAERIIAEALGTKPEEIWPSRYNADGTSKRGTPGSKPLRPAHIRIVPKSTPADVRGNPQK